MNGEHIELAHAFIEQYNLVKGTHYEFECLRKSMFSIPKYKFPVFDIFYQMAFVEGKKRNPIVADLMVLLRLQKRLIIEVVEPRLAKEGTKVSVERCIEEIVDPIERNALSEVGCSKYLLIDGRSFGCIRISDPEFYKRIRLERDKMFERHKGFNKMQGIKDDGMLRELSQLGIPTKHWFREVWLSYRDDEDVLRYLQIW